MAMEIMEKREVTLMLKRLYGFCVEGGGEPERPA
jgi:hypothetical protein